MPQVFLHGLDVVPGAEAVDSVGVTEIMEPKVLQPDLLHNALKVHVQGLVIHEASKLIGENQIVGVIPCFSCCRSPNIVPDPFGNPFLNSPS